MEDKAVFYYKKAFDYFVKKIGNGVTTQHQLKYAGNQIFKDKYFKGVHPVDKIPDLEDKQMCIINVDTSGMPGSHWVACGMYGKKLIIYDSFGRYSSNKDLKNMFSILRKYYDFIVEADHDAEQARKEYNCGQRSLAWLFVFYVLGATAALTI